MSSSISFKYDKKMIKRIRELLKEHGSYEKLIELGYLKRVDIYE